MSMTTSKIVEKLLSKVDLASLIGERVKLQRKSGYTVGLCPFHNEKTPSFVVYPRSYFCFGCKKSGDAISFVRETQGMGFVEAIKWLASKYGVDLPELEETSNYKKEQDLGKKLYSALQHAHIMYMNNINLPMGKEAREYLHGRQFSDKDIKEFGFGYAPRGKSVYEACRGLGLTDSEIIQASLSTGSSGRYYDFFQDRFIIPIYDSYSRLVGFSGRALSSEVLPKYKNSRETPLFNKSSSLFGFYKAKEAIRKGESAILVEGNLDVYRLWKAGFRGACAGMGTAINEGHLKQVSYFTNKLYLILDGDFAGKKATIATIDIALKVPDLNISVCVLPSGHDPDSFILEYGSDGFKDLVENHSLDLVDYVVGEVLKGATSLEIPHKVSTSILPWLSRLKDPIQRSYLISRISDITGIDAGELHRQLRFVMNSNQGYTGLKRKVDQNVQEQKPVKKLTIELTPLDREFLANLFLLSSDDDTTTLIQRIQEVSSYIRLDESWSVFIKEIISILRQGGSPSDSEIYTKMSSYLDTRVVSFIQWVQKNIKAFTGQDRKLAIENELKEYKKRYYQSEIEQLKMQLSSNPEDSLTILQSISSLNNEIKNL